MFIFGQSATNVGNILKLGKGKGVTAQQKQSRNARLKMPHENYLVETTGSLRKPGFGLRVGCMISGNKGVVERQQDGQTCTVLFAVSLVAAIMFTVLRNVVVVLSSVKAYGNA